MKTLTLICKTCGDTQVFRGKTLVEIIRRMDNSGWHDFPEGHDVTALCPACDAANDAGDDEAG